MKAETTAVLISQCGQELDIKNYRDNAEHEALIINASNQKISTIGISSKGLRNDRQQPNTTEPTHQSISRLQPVIQFFEGMPSFEQVTLVVTHPGDFRHILTMSSQTAVMRLLPFFIEGKIHKVIELPGIDLSLDTHPFLKSGWIQQELHSIITDELIKNDRCDSMTHVLKEITERFQKKLELLYLLHNYATTYNGQCSSVCNGLATAIMCVEFILLNPRNIVEKMSTLEGSEKEITSEHNDGSNICSFRVL
jgi:hypothetical protein